MSNIFSSLFRKRNRNDNNITGQIKIITKYPKQDPAIRILFLGTLSAGKTTIIKQLQKIHNTLKDDDISDMKYYIQNSVVGYMKLLCYQYEQRLSDVMLSMCNSQNYYEHSKKVVFGYVKITENQYDKLLIPIELTQLIFKYYETNEVNNETLRNEVLQLTSPYKLEDNQLSDTISTLWGDPRIKETLNMRSNLYQIDENVAYFLDKIDDISKRDYTPTVEDFLRIRTRSTGFSMRKIATNVGKLGEFTFEITDVGGARSERKKWMKIQHDNIDCVIYVVAISDYDLKLFEDNNTNRLVEALSLFRNLVRGRFFNGKSVLMFFNKYDLFKEKIKRVPITVAFPDFPMQMNPYDENEVVKFVANNFLQCFEGKNVKLTSPLHIHRTNALDTENMKRVFDDIMIDLIKSEMENNI